MIEASAFHLLVVFSTKNHATAMDRFMLRIVSTACLLLFTIPVAAAPPLPTLADIRNHQLGPSDSVPVDFLATVTYADSVYSFTFVQDGPNAIFVYDYRGNNIKAGDAVRVRGTLHHGDLSPVIRAKRIDRVQDGSLPTPEPLDFSSEDLRVQDCKFVSTECEVLQVFVQPQHSLLYCRNGDNFFFLTVGRWKPGEIEKFVGRRIRCKGSLGIQLKQPIVSYTKPGNPKNIVDALRLFVSPCDSIELLDGPARELVLPYSEIQSLVSNQSKASPKRFETHGQISLVEDGEHPAITIFDAHRSMRIECSSVVDMLPGMVLRVVGDRRQTNQQTSFHADHLHLLVQSQLTAPTSMTVAEGIQSYEPNRRMAIEGMPTIVKQSGDETWFELSDGKNQIDVHILDSNFDGSKIDPNLVRRLRVVGVATSASNPDSSVPYTISVSSGDDITVLESRLASARVALAGLACCLLALAISMAWVRTLRASVAEQTKVTSAISAHLRSSYEAIADGVLAVDSDFNTLAVNGEFQRLTRMKLDIGQPAAEIQTAIANRLRDSQEFQQTWDAWIENKNSVSSCKLEFVNPEHRYVVARTAPIRLPDTEAPIGRLFILCDETENRRLEAEVLRSNKLEAVGRMVGGVAHDFNNVLTAIAANLSVARLDESACVGDVKQVLSVAEDAAFRGADIVRRLLTLASKPKFHLEPHSINAIIERLEELMRHTFDATFEFEFLLAHDNPTVNVDSTAIEQVLLNLYVNAKDAMPEGGKITTTSKVIRNPGTDEDFVLISVCDDGVGIPPEVADKVFEPFFTTKRHEHGTGLGLSVSYRILQQHGGSIHYVPGTNGGSDFRVMLPVETANEVPIVTSDLIESGDGTVLVVDDEDVVRSVAQTMLHRYGYRTVPAVNGEQALARMQESHKVECVLLDLTMPGMPGREVLSKLKTRYPELPVILCSGYLVSGTTTPNGPDAEIQKPYSLKQLISTVNDVLAQSRAKASWKNQAKESKTQV